MIVTGSGPSKEAAIADLQSKLQFAQVRELAFQSQEYDAGTGLWTALAMAVLLDDPTPTYTVGSTDVPVPEKRPDFFARFFRGGGGD